MDDGKERCVEDGSKSFQATHPRYLYPWLLAIEYAALERSSIALPILFFT